MAIGQLRTALKSKSCSGLLFSFGGRNNDMEVEQRGNSLVVLMHGWIGQTIFSHLLQTRGVDFQDCEKVVEMMIKDLNSLQLQMVLFRCANEPSILALRRAVKLAWPGDVAQEKYAEGGLQFNSLAESSVKVVKGHVRSIKLGVVVGCSSVSGS